MRSHEVVDVTHDLGDRRVGHVRTVLAQERDREVDADDAVRVADRVQLRVEQVARRGTERVRVRVRRDERRVGQPGDVPEACLVQSARDRRGSRAGCTPARARVPRPSAPARCRATTGSGTARPRRSRSAATRRARSSASLASYQSSRFDRSAAIGSAPSMWTIAVTSPVAEVVGRRRTRDRQRAQLRRRAPQRSASGLCVRDRLGGSGTAYGSLVGSGTRGDGTYSAKKPPENPAASAASRSRCSVGSPRQRCRTRSLCPSMITAASYGRTVAGSVLRGRDTPPHPGRRRRRAARRAGREHARRGRALRRRRPGARRRRGGSALRGARPRHRADGHRHARPGRHRRDARDPSRATQASTS